MRRPEAISPPWRSSFPALPHPLWPPSPPIPADRRRRDPRRRRSGLECDAEDDLRRHPARGGHATNALPQRARANVNCRIFPGTGVEQVRRALEAVVADPQVKISTLETRSEIAPPPPLTEKVLGPARKIAAKVFPGVPLVPLMAAGGTDAAFLTPAGIPTYGLSGLFSDREGSHAHGLDERIRVKSLIDACEFLYRLVKAYSK